MLREFYILLETIILTVVYDSVVLGAGLMTGILYGFGRDNERDICNWNVIWFYNYNRNHHMGGPSIGSGIGNENIIR